MAAMGIFIPVNQNLVTPLDVAVRLQEFGLSLGLTIFTLAELFCGHS
jgi:hypothetical protein